MEINMKINILTSGFPHGFPPEFAEILNKLIMPNSNFVFIASEFESMHEQTDSYFRHFLKMFNYCGIFFENTCVIDSRVDSNKAQEIIASADILWLSGGDTPTQFKYIENYGLKSIIKLHDGITIGMSAGSINMTKTAICTLTCGHNEQKIYPGLNLVDFSVEPHLDSQDISDELLHLSEQYPIYGMCDNSFILEKAKEIFFSEIYF
jgi:dipeptidase E